MASESKYSDQDLKILHEKKIELLSQWFQLAQNQLIQMKTGNLDPILAEKEECIDNLKRIDTLITEWEIEKKRPYNADETAQVERIRQGFVDIERAESKFEKRLQQELDSLSKEMGGLSNRSQLKNYLGAGYKNAMGMGSRKSKLV